jgi:1D-myo-inositol-tetrakisphosphate 5-kinase/inositol-polyphosphate multikinase
VRFFPLPTDSIPALASPPTPTSSTTTSPTSSAAPHLPLPPVDAAAPVAPATPTSGKAVSQYTSHAIRPKALLRVLSLIDNHLEQLQRVLQTLEARFIGSSVLIVYEGDPERLEDALDRWDAKQAQRALLASEGLGRGPADNDEDDDEDDDDSGLFEDGDDEDSSTSSDDDEDDGARADARKARRCPPVTVRMIDFAHTMLVEGEGPDEGVLKGLDTLRGLVRGRSELVRQAVYEDARGGDPAAA